MIKHITGTPGTGKTYFAVREIITRYYKFDSELFEYVQDTEKEKRPIHIITNIECLKLKHTNLDEYLQYHDISVYEFFTTAHWEKNIDYQNYQVVLILDEAQQYFPSSYRLHGTPEPSNNPLFWFQYHRHFGVDVYIITQTYDSVCRHIVALAEYEIHARTRVYSMGNSFHYIYRTGLSPDAILQRKTVAYSKKIGMLYQSFQADTEEKGKPNPLKKLIPITVILFLILVFGFTRFLSSFSSSDEGGGVPRTVGAAAERTPPPPQDPEPKPEPKPKKEPEKPEVKLPEKQVMLTTGGMWQNSKLLAIEFYGDLIPPDEFDFTYYNDAKNREVRVLLPLKFLDQVQVAKNRRYYESESGWKDIESEQYTPDRDYSNFSDRQLAKNEARQLETSRRERVQERINRDLPF